MANDKIDIAVRTHGVNALIKALAKDEKDENSAGKKPATIAELRAVADDYLWGGVGLAAEQLVHMRMMNLAKRLEDDERLWKIATDALAAIANIKTRPFDNKDQLERLIECEQTARKALEEILA